MTDMSRETVDGEEHFRNSALSHWFIALDTPEQDEFIADITERETAYVTGFSLSYTDMTALTVEYKYIKDEEL